jgi:hypothetical protein
MLVKVNEIRDYVNHTGLDSPLITKSWSKIICFCNAHRAG